MKAICNDTVIAESDDTVVVEGNHYFPSNSLKSEYFQKNETTSMCPWKGMASYYSVTIDEKTNIVHGRCGGKFCSAFAVIVTGSRGLG